MNSKTRFLEVIKGTPIDITARLVTGAGEHYPEDKPDDPRAISHIEMSRTHAYHSTKPHLLINYESRGYKFGRFTVMGKFLGAKARYSCRCSCGAYEVRTHRAMYNPKNRHDACYFCARDGGEQRLMTFWNWLKQQKDRDDPIGDLSRDAQTDPTRKHSAVRWWRDYLEKCGACDGAIDALNEAWEEFQRLR